MPTFFAKGELKQTLCKFGDDAKLAGSLEVVNHVDDVLVSEALEDLNLLPARMKMRDPGWY